MKTLHHFLAAVRGDTALARGLAEAIADRQGPESDVAAAAYAKAAGFEVTARDIEAFRTSTTCNGALSDEELDAVSGAGFFDDFGKFVSNSVRDADQATLKLWNNACDGIAKVL